MSTISYPQLTERFMTVFTENKESVMTVATESEKLIKVMQETLREVARLQSKENELLWSLSKQLHTLHAFLDPVDTKDEKE